MSIVRFCAFRGRLLAVELMTGLAELAADLWQTLMTDFFDLYRPNSAACVVPGRIAGDKAIARRRRAITAEE